MSKHAASSPLVGVVMGSRSDWDTMQHAVARLEQLGIAHEVQVVSAHRTPDLLFQYAESAAARGLRVAYLLLFMTLGLVVAQHLVAPVPS